MNNFRFPHPSTRLGKRKREAIKMLARCYIENRGDAQRQGVQL
jgi:hypothetical protein